MERLDEEYTKILQATDAHSLDFVTKSVLGKGREGREGDKWGGKGGGVEGMQTVEKYSWGWRDRQY